MEAVMIISVIFGSILAGLVIVGGTILLGIKLAKGGLSKKERQEQSDEAKVIQEVYRGLQKMEERIEALETILMDGKDKGR